MLFTDGISNYFHSIGNQYFQYFHSIGNQYKVTRKAQRIAELLSWFSDYMTTIILKPSSFYFTIDLQIQVVDPYSKQFSNPLVPQLNPEVTKWSHVLGYRHVEQCCFFSKQDLNCTLFFFFRQIVKIFDVSAGINSIPFPDCPKTTSTLHHANQ